MNRRFDAYELVLELIRALQPLLARLRMRDPDLSRQLRRAASSVANNVSEGARRRGADRLHHYSIAAGSTAEVRACLATAVAWGDLPSVATLAVDALCDRELAVLYRLRFPRS